MNDSQDLTTAALSRRLLKNHVRPHILNILCAVVCMAIAAGMTAALAKLMQPILDEIFIQKNQTKLWGISFLVFAAFVIRGIASYGQDYLTNLFGQKIVTDFQRQMYGRLMRADLHYFHQNASGQLISRFTNDLSIIRIAVANGVTSVGKDIMTMIFLVALMIMQDPKLSMIALVVLPIAFFPIVYAGQRMRRVARKTQSSMGDLTSRLEQSIHGIRHIKAYNREAHEEEKTHYFIQRIMDLNIRAGAVRAAPKVFMEILTGFTIIVIVIYGGQHVIDGKMTTGEFFSFVTALMLAYEPLKRLARLNTSLQEGLAACQRIFTIMDLQPTIKDEESAKDLYVAKGDIRFDNVSFIYPSTHETVLDRISLTIPAGKTVAIVGPSGAGKSTILNLIPRFFDVTGGSIFIDDQNIKDVTMASLRDHIGLVSQETSLFDDTIAANIRFGKLDATDEEMVAAAQKASAHDFIMAMPDRYDTRIGENGVMLSGGQRQRVMIARAILKNAPILLLDEATSSLDAESEAAVVASLADLMHGRTSIVVAHRLSTIVEADQIYLVDKTGIVETGNHAELIAKNGLYAKLFSAQLMDI